MILTKPTIEALLNDGVIQNLLTNIVKVEAVSVMLHLDNQFSVYEEIPEQPFLPPKEIRSKTITVSRDSFYVLPPHGQVIACTQETIKMPMDLMGFIQTRGSLARGFLMAHVCDGQIEPGYNGKITLEIVNLSNFYYKLVPGMEFCSLFFYKLDQKLNQTYAYNGRYQGSTNPTLMRDPVS
jgi:dCTP deaminase